MAGANVNSSTATSPGSCLSRVLSRCVRCSRGKAAHGTVAPLHGDLELGSLSRPRVVAGKLGGDHVTSKGLDAFYTAVYNYYQCQGFWNIVVQRVTAVLLLMFTIGFAMFLAVAMDWSRVANCSSASAESCATFASYVVNPFQRVGSWQWRIALVCLPMMGLVVYVAWSVVASVDVARNAWRMRLFYRNTLRITTREMQTMEWQEVVERLGEVMPCSNPDISLAEECAMRIMRRDNYLIMWMATTGTLLHFCVRLPVVNVVWHVPMTRCLEWNLKLTLLNWVLDDEGRMRVNAGRDADILRQRFRHLGYLNLILLPFVLPFLLVYFAFRHAEEFQTKRTYLGPRAWSTAACWAFRGINELPHVLERRMNAALHKANAYHRQFPDVVLASCARCLSFVCASVLSVLVVVALFNEHALAVSLAGKNLLWYTAFLSALFAISRAFIPDPQDTADGPEHWMRQVSSLTQWCPPSWRGRLHTVDVRNEFVVYFRFRLVNFLEEMLGVVSAPFLLIRMLPCYADQFVETVQGSTVSVEGIGSVCSLSVFNRASLASTHHLFVETSLLNFYVNHVHGMSPTSSVAMVCAQGIIQKLRAAEVSRTLTPDIMSTSVSLGMRGTCELIPPRRARVDVYMFWLQAMRECPRVLADDLGDE